MILLDKRLILITGLAIILIGFGIVVLMPPDDSSIDSDRDGITNDKDVFPKDSSEWNDTDGDGVGDNQDKFPFDPAASLDSDDDGYPDEWNEGKNASDSTSIPPLILDDLPFDPNEYQDSDGDGFGDKSDVFPFNKNEWSDDDNDGIGGNADSNPLVNLSVELIIDKCVFSQHVDILPWAQIYFVISINNQSESIVFDNGGSFWRMWKNRQTSINTVFRYDIPDDTDNLYTDIEIAMYDYDFFFEDDIIDINSENGVSSLKLTLNHRTNKISGTGVSEGNKGTIWYRVNLGNEVEQRNLTINKTYQFQYNNSDYEISIEIPKQKYQWYQDRLTFRRPQQLNSNDAMASFVTENDVVISQLASTLEQMALAEGFSEVEQMNFVLSFVQHVVTYRDDNSTAGCEEYWRYPVETLVEERGDCEDSTLLFASITKNLDIETVLLFYVLDETNGHLASGIHLMQNISGSHVEYNDLRFYYCETTSVGFSVGKKPSEIPDDPEEIIPL